MNIAGANGITPLMLATGADVNLVDKQGATPLILVAQKYNSEIVAALIEAGADVNVTGEDGVTPLMNAARKGYSGLVRQLIESGADVNRTEMNGATALLFAGESSNRECMTALIEEGAGVNKRLKNGATQLMLAAVCNLDVLVDDKQQTALIGAVAKGHDRCLNKLLDAGADVHVTNEQGVGPLMVAGCNGHNKCVDILKAALFSL